MKFLHEMIAKKRAQQAGEAREEDWQVRAKAAASQAPARQFDAGPAKETAVAEDEAWDEDEDWDEEDADDAGDLFDDGSYDWELEESGDEDDDGDEDEVSGEDEPAEEDLRIAARARTAPAETRTDAAADDDDDVGRGVSMVLKDLAKRSEATAPEPAAAQPEPKRSTLEENVEKLRIQRKIWDMENGDDGTEDGEDAPVAAAPMPRAVPVPPRAVPDPAPAAAAPPQPQPRRAGRVKTRLLGFHKPEDMAPDPFAAPQTQAAPQGEPQFPVGWLIVMKGPGRGASFTLTAGASKIGRGEDQAIRLDFGDTTISRDNHAAVAYDEEQRCFYVGHGGKANLVRLNDMPVLSTEVLADGDEIRIGETTLRLVAFCGPEFSWNDENGDGDSRYAAAE
jgi:hypothetical protein